MTLDMCVCNHWIGALAMDWAAIVYAQPVIMTSSLSFDVVILVVLISTGICLGL